MKNRWHCSVRRRPLYPIIRPKCDLCQSEGSSCCVCSTLSYTPTTVANFCLPSLVAVGWLQLHIGKQQMVVRSSTHSLDVNSDIQCLQLMAGSRLCDLVTLTLLTCCCQYILPANRWPLSFIFLNLCALLSET